MAPNFSPRRPRRRDTSTINASGSVEKERTKLAGNAPILGGILDEGRQLDTARIDQEIESYLRQDLPPPPLEHDPVDDWEEKSNVTTSILSRSSLDLDATIARLNPSKK